MGNFCSRKITTQDNPYVYVYIQKVCHEYRCENFGNSHKWDCNCNYSIATKLKCIKCSEVKSIIDLTNTTTKNIEIYKQWKKQRNETKLKKKLQNNNQC